jgi:hypothetical protein
MISKTPTPRRISRRHALSLAVAGAGVLGMKSAAAQEAAAKDPRITGGVRHIVLIRFPDDCPVKTINSIFEQLNQIRSTLPGMIGFHSGPDVTPGQRTPRFTHGVTIDFADQAARDAYWVHPGHGAVGQRLMPLLKGDREALQIFQVPL